MIESEFETCVFVAVTIKAFVTVRFEAKTFAKFATPVSVMFLAVMDPFIISELSVVAP
jgi:hypothetical protein